MDDALKQALTLGRGFYESKEYSKAEPYLRSIVDEQSGFADVHNMLGVIYHDQSLFEQAEQCFAKAVEINPKYTEAALNLSVTYNDQGKYHEAKQVYQSALSNAAQSSSKLDPFVTGKIANMYAEIGDVYVSCGAFREALVEYQRALSLRGQFLDIRLKLASTYRDLGDRDSAMREYDAVLQQQANFVPALTQRGLTYYGYGELQKALDDFSKVLEREPDNERIKLYLSMVQDRQIAAQNQDQRDTSTADGEDA